MKYAYRIKLADTDAAGRIYFTAACEIAHEAFEHFMDVIGFGISDMIADGSYGLPVVELKAKYDAPLTLGQTITVDTTVKEVREKCVTFKHELIDEKKRTSVIVTITHAAVSGKTGKAIALPAKLTKALEQR